MKQKLVGIILLFSLVLPIATTFTFLHIQKKAVRKEVKHKIIAGIDKEELVLLKFTPVEMTEKLKWKHSKEFEFQGQMYDIVSKEIYEDTTYFYCWWDHKESQLNRQLDHLLAKVWGNNHQKNESQKRLVSFYQLLFCCPIPELQLKPVTEEYLQVAYNENYYSLSLPPSSPHPKIQ